MANLPIPDETTWIKYDDQTGAGPFSFTFSVFAKADLRVKVGDTELEQSGFTFTGTLIDTGYDGGSITLVTAAAAEDVLIWREVAPARASDFAPASSISVLAIDAALDRLTAHAQDARRDLDRAIKVALDADTPADTTYDEMIADAGALVGAEALALVEQAGEDQVAAVEAAADLVLNVSTGTLTVAAATALTDIETAADEVLDPVTGTLTTALADALDDVAAARDAAQIYHETWTGLAAISGTFEGQSAKCFAASGTHTDPVVGGTVDDPGVYRWSASPAGWKRLGDLSADNASADAAAAAASATAAEAAAEYLPSAIRGILRTQTVGNTGSFASAATGVGNFTYEFTPVATRGRTLKTVRFKSSSTTSFKIKKGVRDGDEFTSAEDDLIITPASAAEHTLTTADFGVWEVDAGQSVAVFGNGSLVYQSATGVPYYSMSGDITSTPGTDSSTDTARLVAIELTFENTLSATEIEAATAAVSPVLGQRVGCAGTPIDGTASGSDRQYVFSAEMAGDEWCDQIVCYSKVTVDLPIYKYALSTASVADDTKTRGDLLFTLPLIGGQINTFSAWEGHFEAFELTSTERPGFWDKESAIPIPTQTHTGTYWDTTSSSASWTDTALNTSLETQFAFIYNQKPDVDLDKIKAVNDRVWALENPTYATPTEWVMFCIAPAQSNGQGQGEVNDDAPQTGIAKMWNDSTLVDLADPTSTQGSSAGSAWGAFATEFTKRTGKGVIIVNEGVSGTKLTTNWASSGSLRADTMTAINGAAAAADADGLAWQFGGFISVIGEGDSADVTAGTKTIGEITTAWDSVVAYFRTQMGTKTPFYVCRTGTFTSPSGSSTVADTAGLVAIREAQMDWCREGDGVYMAWTGAYNLAGRGLIKDTVHYETAGLREMGVSVAVCAAAHYGEGA